MTMPLDKMTKVYQVKSKKLYPCEYFKNENTYNNMLGNMTIEDFRPSLKKLPPLKLMSLI